MRMARLLPGVGSASAAKLWSDWLKCEGSRGERMTGMFSEHLCPMKVPKKAREDWDQLAYTLDELLDHEGRPVRPASMIRSIVEGVYEDYMKVKFKNYEQRAQDLEQLSSFSDRFDDAFEFLSQLSLLSGVDTENDPASDPAEREAVTLTTAHQAKGLEWGAVFAIWLADGMFPHKRAVDDGGEAALEEERRLFYVTVTRAKDELYLSYPVLHHQARDGDVFQRPSRFLKDVPKELMEPWNIRGGF